MAVDRNPDVMEMVEEELRENPDISNKDLKFKAEEIDEDIEDLSNRQFNARYPLQVKRKRSTEAKASQDGGAPQTEQSEETEAPAEDAEEQGDGASKEQVLEMIEEALRENPDVSNKVLQERAAEIDASIEGLSGRQFHARYPLQVKRQMSAEQKTEEEQEQKEEETTEQAPDTEELRPELRQTLIDFAKDVAGAESHGKLMDVVLNVDEYVDRVMEKA